MLATVQRSPTRLSNRWRLVLRHDCLCPERLLARSEAAIAFRAGDSGERGRRNIHLGNFRRAHSWTLQEASPFSAVSRGALLLSKAEHGSASDEPSKAPGQAEEGSSSSSSSGSSSSSRSGSGSHGSNDDSQKKEAQESSKEEGDGQKEGHEGDKKGPSRKQVHFIARRPTDLLEALSLPFRHILASTKLFLVGLSFPGGWESEEFKKGAPEAFSYILEFLHQNDMKDIHELRGMLSDKLIERIQEEEPDPAFLNRERKVHFEKLTNVRMNGILWAAVHVDSETGGSYLHVKVLMSATEVFRVGEEDDESWHFRRLHRWTFRRDLPNEDWESPGEWHVVALSRIQPHFPKANEYDG